MSDLHDVSQPPPLRPEHGFTWLARFRSFGFALQGITFMLRTQHNAWLHLAASLLVVGAAVFYRLNANEWCWLIAAMAMVWVAETMNTAVEYVCDVVAPHHSLAVKHAKDIAAGGVLMAAAGAAAIGVITFWPHLSRTGG